MHIEVIYVHKQVCSYVFLLILFVVFLVVVDDDAVVVVVVIVVNNIIILSQSILLLLLLANTCKYVCRYIADIQSTCLHANIPNIYKCLYIQIYILKSMYECMQSVSQCIQVACILFTPQLLLFLLLTLSYFLIFFAMSVVCV